VAVLGGHDDGSPQRRIPDPRRAGTYFGVHTKVEGDDDSQAEAAVEKLERDLGRKIDIDHNFYPWDSEFPTDLERWDLKQDRVPMISWNGRGAYASDIAAGKHDPLIVDRAVRVKNLKKPVLIRWFWEMDGKNKSEWAQSPADYIAAWRHIVDTFKDKGAKNVSWVWCPNASAFDDGSAQAFYPGDGYVDWICGDGYNWAPGRPNDRWESFSDIFRGFYGWASKQGKPLMVGEFGVQERQAGEKADWIRNVGVALKSEFPLIRAVVYFNANQKYDWRIDSSPSSIEAFKVVANDRWFTGAIENALPK
jgi:hypothetical protein